MYSGIRVESGISFFAYSQVGEFLAQLFHSDYHDHLCLYHYYMKLDPCFVYPDTARQDRFEVHGPRGLFARTDLSVAQSYGEVTNSARRHEARNRRGAVFVVPAPTSWPAVQLSESADHLLQRILPEREREPQFRCACVEGVVASVSSLVALTFFFDLDRCADPRDAVC